MPCRRQHDCDTLPKHIIRCAEGTWWTSRIFYCFFLLRGGEGGVRGVRKEGGLLKIPGGGSPGRWEGAGGPGGQEGVCRESEEGGGVQYLFRSKFPPRGFFFENFGMCQGFPFSGVKAPQNFQVAQVSASLVAGGLYLADVPWPVRLGSAFTPEKENPPYLPKSP